MRNLKHNGEHEKAILDQVAAATEALQRAEKQFDIAMQALHGTSGNGCQRQGS